MQQAPVQIGEILADKFRVERILGVGGMGVVVAATHLHLDKIVAIKFMLGVHGKDSDIAGRFLREAKAAARLKSQHIAKVLDVGTMQDGAPYMVMEFLDGSDLEQVITKRLADGLGPLPYAEAVDYMSQACLGMAEAHGKALIHRDLKPPNLFLCRGEDGMPLIKILDFGIAKAGFDGIQTSTQAVMGSPFYMSPEQWQGARHVDERGDIWALGAILYFLLSGTEPFKGASLPELFASIATRKPASLRSLVPQLPEGLEKVVSLCLEKNPSERPQTVAELVMLLAPFGPTHVSERARKAARIASSADRPAGLAALPEAGEATRGTTMGASAGQLVAMPLHRDVVETRSHSRWLPVTIAVFMAAAVAVLLYFVVLGGDKKVAEPVAATGSEDPVHDQDESLALVPGDEGPIAEDSVDEELEEPIAVEPSSPDAAPQEEAIATRPETKRSSTADSKRATRKPSPEAASRVSAKDEATPAPVVSQTLTKVAETPVDEPSSAAATDALPPLGRDQVKSAMVPVSAAVLRCARTHSLAPGKVSAKIVITPGGASSGTMASGSAEFRSCAEQAIARAQLPASPKGVALTYAFVVPRETLARLLGSADLAEGMRFVRPSLNLCRKKHGDNELVVIHMQISSGGAVVKARVDDSRTAYKTCLEEVAKRARFKVTRDGFKGGYRYRAAE